MFTDSLCQFHPTTGSIKRTCQQVYKGGLQTAEYLVCTTLTCNTHKECSWSKVYRIGLDTSRGYVPPELFQQLKNTIAKFPRSFSYLEKLSFTVPPQSQMVHPLCQKFIIKVLLSIQFLKETCQHCTSQTTHPK